MIRFVKRSFILYGKIDNVRRSKYADQQRTRQPTTQPVIVIDACNETLQSEKFGMCLCKRCWLMSNWRRNSSNIILVSNLLTINELIYTNNYTYDTHDKDCEKQSWAISLRMITLRAEGVTWSNTGFERPSLNEIYKKNSSGTLQFLHYLQLPHVSLTKPMQQQCESFGVTLSQIEIDLLYISARNKFPVIS